MSRGAFALFAETSSRTVDSVTSFSRTFAVPLVTPSAPLDTPPVTADRRYPSRNEATRVLAPADASGYVAFMRPPYQRALADVIHYYKWPRLFYVYDNNEGNYDTSNKTAPTYHVCTAMSVFRDRLKAFLFRRSFPRLFTATVVIFDT